MKTLELIERMTKLGWEMPKQLAIEGSVAMYDEQPENGGNWFIISDQHLSDLLCADFMRWINGVVGRVGVWTDATGRKRSLVGRIYITADDYLTALVTAAEAALTQGASS